MFRVGFVADLCRQTRINYTMVPLSTFNANFPCDTQHQKYLLLAVKMSVSVTMFRKK